MKPKSRIKDVHLKNLNEDPLLSGKIRYAFNQFPILSIGRSENRQSQGLFSKEHHIILKGVNIQDMHVKFKYEDKKLILEVYD